MLCKISYGILRDIEVDVPCRKKKKGVRLSS